MAENGTQNKKKKPPQTPAGMDDKLGILKPVQFNVPARQMGIPPMPEIASMAMVKHQQNEEGGMGGQTTPGSFLDKQKNKVARLGKGRTKEEIFGNA